jgi:hypothetical protein
MATHVLPLRALSLISEYSKPITRPEWRRSIPIISPYDLMEFISSSNYIIKYKKHSKLHCCILNNIIKTEWYNKWYHMYIYIKNYGIMEYCWAYNKEYDDIINIKGIQRAQNIYELY